MKVYPCGTAVDLIVEQTKAIITAVVIRYDTIQYECSYFTGEKRECIWVNENEFKTDSAKVKIGFK